jgi:thioredoxin reductase (NADPH)
MFFTSNELLEIGDHPLVSLGPKATRREALDYYRKVAEREGLDVVTHAEVNAIDQTSGGLAIHTTSNGTDDTTTCRAAVVATGYYHRPKRIGVPGEDLPHVSHYYREAHPYWRRRVVIVGGGNSAAEAALELWRAGASVTMLVRGERVRETVKYWVRPDLENRFRDGSITVCYSALVEEITSTTVRFRAKASSGAVAADAVFLLTGFTADATLAVRAGAAIRDDGSVVLQPDTYESSVPGLYVVGSAGFGDRTGEVFIENGRLQAGTAIAHVSHRLRSV